MNDPALSFEQKIVRELKRLESPPKRCLLAVSGGVDSMVLAEVMWRWRQRFSLGLGVAYVHHGMGEGVWPAQQRYRQQAQSFVGAWCERHKLEFFTNSAEAVTLHSEEELRDYRSAWLERWRREGNYDVVAYAHH